jgi:ubiquinone biosynthesis protein
MPVQLAQQLRNLGRYRQILVVLVRHGFADFVRHTGLSAVVTKSIGSLGKRGRYEADLIQQPREVRLRLALEELGPTFIKLGQVLSTRRDLVPDEVAIEFAKLQSECPAVDYADITTRLEQEFPGKLDVIFKSIEEKPLAAASMAQAHRAVLADGSEVVLKILRPGIEEILRSDMEILRFIASVVEDYFDNMGFDPVAVAEEFARELEREVDLMQEARSTENLRAAFADDPGVDFPKVYWEATTKRVLCVEEIKAHLLSRVEPKELSDEARHNLVENGARAVFRMTLDMGFFHADPHPGNIFVRDDGGIIFIDCGMVGHVDLDTRMSIAELVYGVTKNDADMVMACALSLSDVDEDKIDIRRARADVQQLVDQFVGVPMDRIDLAQVLEDFFQTLRRYGLQCPADVVLLIKAMSTIEGVGARFDPDFDLVSFAHPYLARLIKERYSPKAVFRRMRTTSNAYIKVLENIPSDIAAIARKFRKNELKFDFELRSIEELIETAEAATDNVAHALLISAIIVASAILVHAAPEGSWGFLAIIGMAGFIIATVLAFGLVLRSWRHRRGSRIRVKRALKRRR